MKTVDRETVDQMSAARAALMTGSVPLKVDTALRDTPIYCRPHQTASAQRDARSYFEYASSSSLNRLVRFQQRVEFCKRRSKSVQAHVVQFLF